MTRDIGTMRVSFLAFVFLVPLASACGQVQPANDKIAADAAAKKDLAARRVRGATVELFNGRDLAGWTAFQGSDRLPPGSNLVVEKGELRSPAGAKGRLTTDQAFENFSLRLEYRFPIGGTIADSFSSGIGIGTGLQVEGLTESGMIGFQLKPGSAGNIKVAPFKQSAVLPHRRAAERSIGDWNEIEIRFAGADLTVTLNGEQVNQARVLNPGPGRVHFLAWGSDVSYRNIRVITSAPTPALALDHASTPSKKSPRKTSDGLKAARAGGSHPTEPASSGPKVTKSGQHGRNGSVGGHEAGPILGTWSITRTDKAGRLLRGTLVLIREEGTVVDGYVRWRGPDGKDSLEVLAGHYRPDDRVFRIDAVELHTSIRDLALGCYDAVLSADNRKLTDGTTSASLRVKNTGTWSAVWENEEKNIPAELASAFDDSDVYLTLYKNLAGPYMLDGVTIHRVPDVSMLAQLSDSEDRTVQRLAIERWGLEIVRDELLIKTDLTDEVRELREKIRGFMKEAIEAGLRGQKQSFDEVSATVSGTFFEDSDEEESAVHRAQAKAIKASRVAAKGLFWEQFIRTGLRHHLASRRSGVTLSGRSFGTAYGLFGNDTASLVLSNDTDRTLHHCILISQVTIDAATYAQLKARKDRQLEQAKDVSRAAGIDEKTLELTEKLETARAAYERLNKGTIVFVPEWKPGAKLTSALAPLVAVMQLAGSADITLWSDEGRLDETALSLSEIRKAVEKELRTNRRPLNKRR